MLTLTRLIALVAAVLVTGPTLAGTAADTRLNGAPLLIAQADTATPAAASTVKAAAPSAKHREEEESDKETVTNPYGLDALWKGGDMVARSTLVILILMSMGSWYVIATKLAEQIKLNRQAREAGKTFWEADNLAKGVDTLKPGSVFRYIAQSGTDAASRHHGMAAHVDLNTWTGASIQRAVDKIASRTQNGLALLATVGSTAPFVGLFGTVWGIYHALTAIGIAGQASIDKVAGPVGEALIMTAIGLAVAVPAVLGYNFLVRRNKTALERVRTFATEVHSLLLGGGPRTAAAA
jgi:biopolymer transport protein ExbB